MKKLPVTENNGAKPTNVGNLSSMSRRELETFIQRTKEDTNKERTERNFCQLEKDKIRRSWETSKKELEEARAQILIKNKEIEELTLARGKELTFYKNQVNNLQSENQKKISEIREQAEVTLKKTKDGYVAQERELFQDNQNVKTFIKEQEVKNKSGISFLRAHMKKELMEAKNIIETRAKELDTKNEKRYVEMKKLLNSFNM